MQLWSQSDLSPTIYPVFHKNIPILLKNTFNPDAKGTLISSSSDASEGNSDGKAIKGISSISDTCLITVSGLGMVGIVGINARIFNALAREGVSVFMVSQASSENTTSFAVKNEDAARAVEALEKEYAAELASGELNPIHSEHNLATVAIVGENMRNAAVRSRTSVQHSRQERYKCDLLRSGCFRNQHIVCNQNQRSEKALNVIHDSFFSLTPKYSISS